MSVFRLFRQVCQLLFLHFPGHTFVCLYLGEFERIELICRHLWTLFPAVLTCPIDWWLRLCAWEDLSSLGDLRGQRGSTYINIYVYILPAHLPLVRRAESQWNFFVEGAATRTLRVFSEWNQSGIFKASLIRPSLRQGKSSLWGAWGPREVQKNAVLVGMGLAIAVGGVWCWCAH